MLAADRRLKILERVADQQSIEVGRLAAAFAVSEMTIRRDITRLERDGFLRRTYGGATAHVTRALDLAFNARALEHPREKRLIAMTAVGEVQDANVIFLGIGTTCEQFARYVPALAGRTIVTGYLPAASVLGTRPLRTVVLGGTIRRDELTCVGPVAAATLARYRFELAVVGAAGLSATVGVTDLNDDEAEINRLALARAGRVMLLADGSKLGQVATAVVAPAARVDLLVTDPSAPASELQALRELGVTVLIASGRTASDGAQGAAAELVPA